MSYLNDLDSIAKEIRDREKRFAQDADDDFCVLGLGLTRELVVRTFTNRSCVNRFCVSPTEILLPSTPTDFLHAIHRANDFLAEYVPHQDFVYRVWMAIRTVDECKNPSGSNYVDLMVNNSLPYEGSTHNPHADLNRYLMKSETFPKGDQHAQSALRSGIAPDDARLIASAIDLAVSRDCRLEVLIALGCGHPKLDTFYEKFKSDQINMYDLYGMRIMSDFYEKASRYL